MTELKVEERPTDELRCPYCHDSLLLDEEPARCTDCQAPHHATCALEAGQCSARRRRVSLAP